MAILDHDKLVIFSFPRAGTKLLANILENFGYHSFGEWYDTWSSEVTNQSATRISISNVAITKTKNLNSLDRTSYFRVKEITNRFNAFPCKEKAVITIWPDNLFDFPFLLTEYSQYHWICPRRNVWDQLLSWMISFQNSNFNGLVKSHPIVIDEEYFTHFYWKWKKVYLIQDWLVNNYNATIINFDELVDGTSSVFSISYNVASMDEHEELEKLVLNIDQVQKWFLALESN